MRWWSERVGAILCRRRIMPDYAGAKSHLFGQIWTASGTLRKSREKKIQRESQNRDDGFKSIWAVYILGQGCVSMTRPKAGLWSLSVGRY